MSDSDLQVRPEKIREVALWWTAEMEAARRKGDVAESSPPLEQVAARFGCTEEEALRGVCIGEQRHWSGTR